MRVLVFGDSITQGFWDTEGGWVEHLRKHFDGIALQDLNNGPITEVFNLGISGDTTRNLPARIEAETRARQHNDEPLLVLVAIGTNDDLFESDKQWVPPEEFRKNLEEIVSLIQPLARKIVLIGNPACDEARTTPVSWGDFTYTNRELERSEQVIKEVAEVHGLTYIPVFHEFKRRLDAGEDLLEDGLHPNNQGHQLMYEMVRPKLLELLI